MIPRNPNRIIELALRERRVSVTFDHDFHSNLALARAGGPSVILIRAEGLDAAGQAAWIEAVYAHCGDELEAGAAASADRSAVRVRRLPLA